MANQDWSDYLITLVPDHQRGPWGEAFWGSIGMQTNCLSEMEAEVPRSGWVDGEQLPPDLLAIVGEGKNLVQYAGETNEQFQARCLRAWRAWLVAGTAGSITSLLEAVGFTGATCTFHDDRTGPRGEPAPYWSQFWISIPISTLEARPGWTTDPVLGQCVWGCFWWGFGALSVEDARLFWSIVGDYKPTDWVCRGIEIGT